MSASKQQKSEVSKSTKMRIKAFPVSLTIIYFRFFKFNLFLNSQQWMKNMLIISG